MTIDEAIKELQDYEHYWLSIHQRDAGVAMKLGIEALRYVQKLRQASNTVNTWKLPGETKD